VKTEFNIVIIQGQGYRSGQSGHGLTNILVEIQFTYITETETLTTGFDFMNVL